MKKNNTKIVYLVKNENFGSYIEGVYTSRKKAMNAIKQSLSPTCFSVKCKEFDTRVLLTYKYKTTEKHKLIIIESFSVFSILSYEVE